MNLNCSSEGQNCFMTCMALAAAGVNLIMKDYLLNPLDLFFGLSSNEVYELDIVSMFVNKFSSVSSRLVLCLALKLRNRRATGALCPGPQTVGAPKL